MPRRARIRLRVLAVTLFTALLGALLPVAGAHAAARTVQGGRLDWGVKASFQSYITGPIAQGSYSLTGGAATVGASQFRFHSARGSYDGSSGAFSSSFSGGVHFVGHKKSNGTYELDMTISNPTVRIAGGSGTLYVDVVSKAKGTGAVTSSRQVPFASLSLGGINMKGDGNAVALNNLPATLTSQGAQSFAGYYTAGTALDPVSLSADVAPQKAEPSATATKKAESKKEKAKKAKQDATGKLHDGAVDWGVRRTFREYVTGDIAQGEWTLGDGAQDGGALFRFPEGSGTYDKKKQSLKAAFDGSVRFTGEHGLDLKLANVSVTVADGKGTLRADTTSDGKTAEDAALVTFKTGELKAEDGLVAVSEAPAVLTAAGAKAFGGMYKKGTAMDPVSLAVALDADASLPALPDLGSSASPTPTAKAKASRAAEPAAAETDAGLSRGAVAGIVAAVVVVLAAAAGLLIRRGRAARR
ncbi:MULTISPECIES: HtaA domain-containing protein [unclassified Streptomyces]|uniref:HtaA domain-containing protein n=1 Tax=unclassified Streptomyces TaxID=2593676 RepID=UPI000DBA8977|nr:MULTISPECIES: HtaA domain-containing protein [unclassified Streptomyces]MYT70783.1 Htaa domain protein [Streptomyces sp. SID8367]RAJ90488.1 Htaa protein [Streptomyces sp. PsTaAH-137]